MVEQNRLKRELETREKEMSQLESEMTSLGPE